jgi:hypothetical protein
MRLPKGGSRGIFFMSVFVLLTIGLLAYILRDPIE